MTPLRKSLLIISLSYALLGQSKKHAPTWKEYSYPEDGFVVSAPSPLTLREDPQAKGVHLYRIQLDPTTIFIVRTSNMHLDCKGKIEELKGTAKSNMSYRDISLKGNPGLESESKENPEEMWIERFYCLKERVFVLTVQFGRPKPAALNRILESFRLL